MYISVETEKYYNMYLKHPRGFGTWIFKIGNESVWFECMDYSEAKKKAMQKAKSLKALSICLMP